MIKKIFLILISILLVMWGTPVSMALDSQLPVGSVGEANIQSGGDGELISVNFNQAEIHSVFRILAMKGGVNIVAGPEISGEVTIQLNNVPWQSALDTIVRIHGFTYEKEGNIYYVLTPEALKQRRESGVRTEVRTLQYAELAQVTNALGRIATGVTVESVEGMNQIIMTSTPAGLESAQQIIQRIDVRQPQVHIETKIIETQLAESEKLGIDWTTIASLTGARRPTTFPFADDPANRRFDKFLQRFDTLPIGQTASESTVSTTSGGGQNTSTAQEFPVGAAHGFPFVQPEEFTFGTIDFSQFSAVFNMLKSRANTKVLSNPRIVVLNHQVARVQSGREIGIPTFERNESTGSFEITGYIPRNDGVELRVTPHVTAENEILLVVRPELTSFLGFQEIVEGSNVLSPQFTTTVAETDVLINSGDTLVIGGLISETESDTRNKVPFMSRIPIIGWLFKHKSPNKTRKETIIFVTVTLADDVFNQAAVKKWQQKEEEYKKFQQASEEEFFNNRKKEKVEEVAVV